MALIVQKYGGTSVGSVDRIKAVARRVARWKARGHQIVVVPSAMAGETNRLLALESDIALFYIPVEAASLRKVKALLESEELLDFPIERFEHLLPTIRRAAGDGLSRVGNAFPGARFGVWPVAYRAATRTIAYRVWAHSIHTPCRVRRGLAP